MGVTGGATMGVALHLQSGQRRFILGGRDRRVSAGTRLDAPDAGYGQSIDVDAWVSVADFEEILTMVSCRSGLDIRPPGPDEPARCLLFANPLTIDTRDRVVQLQETARVHAVDAPTSACHRRWPRRDPGDRPE